MEALSWLLDGPLALVVAGVLGAVFGSFFNVVIGRLPQGQSVVRPASRCPRCQTPIRARDNVPILSYFLLRGRCRACGLAISARYPLVEALTALLAVAICWKFVTLAPFEAAPVRLGRFVTYFVFAGALVVLSFIDLDTKLLPDVITLPGTVVMFLLAFAAHDAPWSERAIGAAAGYLFVRLLSDFYYYVLKREGLGLGDGKLLAMVGATLGWKALPITLIAGSLLGTLVSLPVLLLARRRQPGAPAAAGAPPADSEGAGAGEHEAAPSLRHVQVPFGPFLAAGALVYLFAGRVLLDFVFPSL